MKTDEPKVKRKYSDIFAIRFHVLSKEWYGYSPACPVSETLGNNSISQIVPHDIKRAKSEFKDKDLVYCYCVVSRFHDSHIKEGALISQLFKL